MLRAFGAAWLLAAAALQPVTAGPGSGHCQRQKPRCSSCGWQASCMLAALDANGKPAMLFQGTTSFCTAS